MRGKSDEQIISEAHERITSVPTWLPFSTYDVPVASRDFKLTIAAGHRPAPDHFSHLVRFKKVFTQTGPEWQFDYLVK